MNGKKTLPLLVIATLMLSILPSMMFANAAAEITLPVEGTAYSKGGQIIVTGTGVVAGTTVQLYWDDATIAWNGVKGLVNSTTGSSSGTFEVWMDVPDAVNGDHYLWVKDSSGNTASRRVLIDALIEFSPSTGLPLDTITVTLSGYSATNKIEVDFAGTILSTPTTNSLGSAVTTFKVPAATPNGVYNIRAQNVTEAISATAPFTVGPVITPSVTTGTVGSVILINGRGFIPGATITQGQITLDGIACYITTADTVTVDATGRFRLNAVIPQTDDTIEYDLIVAPTGDIASTTTFEVTALAQVTVSPSFGPVASNMIITGVNFPRIAGTDVVITFNGADLVTVETLADGSFTRTVKVPAQTEGTYSILANAAVYLIDDDVNFRIGSMNIILSDNSAPTGASITLSGNGFSNSGTWNATLGSETIIDGQSISAAGLLQNGQFQVPQIAAGTYTITVWDIAAEIMLTEAFTVTATTNVTLGVSNAPNGFNVTLTGAGFSDNELVGNVVDLVIYNTTSSGALDFWWTIDAIQLPVGVGALGTDEVGEFYGYWIVDADDILSKGNYKINVTDASGNYAVTVPFTVGDEHVVATSRKASYARGEIISFTLEHTFGNVSPILNGDLTIYNPTNVLMFDGDQLGTWIQTNGYYTAPFSTQTASGNPMTLPDDAPTGTWRWVWRDVDGDTITQGNFNVTAAATGSTDEQIAALAAQIAAVTTNVNNLQTTVAGVATTATAASNAATAASNAATAASAAATQAASAATAAQAAAESAAAASNGLTTLVYAAIGASLIAALAAIVALMQISRKIA